MQFGNAVAEATTIRNIRAPLFLLTGGKVDLDIRGTWFFDETLLSLLVCRLAECVMRNYSEMECDFAE